MTILPRKHSRKGPKINRGPFGRFNRRPRRPVTTNPTNTPAVKINPWTGRPANQPVFQGPWHNEDEDNGQQQPAQNQGLPADVPAWWRAVVLFVMALLALMVLLAIIGGLFPNNNNGPGPNGNDCTCYCDNGRTCHHNSDCPSDGGVPGVCGKPVDCAACA